MSAEDYKKADLVIRYSLRGIIALGVGACAIVFNGMRDGIYKNSADIEEVKMEVKKETSDIRERLVRLETQMVDLQKTMDKRP